MCTRYPIINRVSELKVHIELTRFVQPEKIEIDANERAVNEKSQYCFFVCTTFGLFCNGLEVFDEAYKNGTFYRVFTTNGVYQTPELLSRDWYESVDLSKYTAYFLDTLNHDMSVSSLLDCSDKIEKILIKKGLKEEK